MKLKKNYKMLLTLFVLLICVIVVSDSSLAKSIAGIGGGFLDDAVKSVSSAGGDCFSKIMNMLPNII